MEFLRNIIESPYQQKHEGWYKNISCEYVFDKYDKAFPDFYVSLLNPPSPKPCKIFVDFTSDKKNQI